MLGAGGAGSESQLASPINALSKLIGMIGLDVLCLGGVLGSRVNCVSIDI